MDTIESDDTGSTFALEEVIMVVDIVDWEKSNKVKTLVMNEGVGTTQLNRNKKQTALATAITLKVYNQCLINFQYKIKHNMLTS